MKKINITILGHQGMLGSMVLDVLSRDPDLQVTATGRDHIDATTATVKSMITMRAIKNANWIINCIGKIKPYCHEDNMDEVVEAIIVNSVFPHRLAQASSKTNTKVIQIATDCVYTGEIGDYIETDEHDATDLYGRTKSFGEVRAENFYNLRCSIIGPEEKNHLSLLDWFLSQPKKAEVNGFTNHLWNGMTTLQFAKICQGIIKQSISLSHIQHIIPANTVSKAQLLQLMAEEFDRKDIVISKVRAPQLINRTLKTIYPGINEVVWEAAGYSKIPTIEEMVHELYEAYLNKRREMYE